MEQQSTSGSWLPSDMISEILIRLPAKSVGRFRCVSKLWLSITTDPRFIKSFGTTRRPSLLLCSIKDDNMFVNSISSSYSSSSPQPFHPYPKKLPGKRCYFSRMDSVHGLICIYDSDSKNHLVWNPTTRQLLVLPKPNLFFGHNNALLGYDSVEDKHKVVCLPHGITCYVCRVFTLGTGQESWRTVRTNFNHTVETFASDQSVETFASGRCIKGVIYYLARNSHSQGGDTVVMSFDVRSEIFHMIELPSRINGNVLISYEGRLACLDAKNAKRLWSLEDADKHKWSFQDFISRLYMFTEPQGSTHAGDIIYVRQFRELSYIYFYDPVRNSWRDLKFEGVVKEDFGHTVIKAFTNHIESLVPL